jgi:predicted RNase H-like nuclease (RuvC/YqgF family)
VTPAEEEALRRENQYLKTRVAALQADLGDLNAEVERMRQRLEHASAARRATQPNPLGGGQ